MVMSWGRRGLDVDGLGHVWCAMVVPARGDWRVYESEDTVEVTLTSAIGKWPRIGDLMWRDRDAECEFYEV